MDANWYPDPHAPGTLRYWDGQAWTEHTAPDPAAGAADPAAQQPGAAPQPMQAQQAAPASMPASLMSSTLFTENQEAATTGRMTRQNAAVVKATLSGMPLMVTRGAMIAFQGDITFAYQGSGGVGKYLKAAATGEGMKLMRCEGTGELFVSHGGNKLHLLELAAGEQLSASSRALLGFDQSVTYDIQMIKGGLGAMAAGGLFNVTLTGPGTVILATDWPVVLNTSEARTLVDPNAVVAWTAGLTVTPRSSMSAGALIGRGSGEAMQLEFSPGGYVIVEPEQLFGPAA
ncbi:MAG: AIM24 family protein [Microthrixaceae bacterium]